MRSPFSFLLLAVFILNTILGPLPLIQAEEISLPKPGVMVHLSPQFSPAHLKGLTIHTEDPFKFDFIVQRGDQSLSDRQKHKEYKKLIKYFLASLAIPDEDQWVNLSPYEKDRIIKDDFGKTEMGRDLLAQDYILKQLTASMIYPEDQMGKKFWDKVYSKAQQQFGTTHIPVDTFNKVWIVPDDAEVYEKGNTAYVLKNHLKVMLEEDYLSLSHHTALRMQHSTDKIGNQVVREIVIPALEREVNEGKNFAPLRQVYSGMILAAWYKRTLKESLLGKMYANKAKVKGVDQDPKNNTAIYQHYLEAYKKGVFNYIRDDADQLSHNSIPRKYFSGGTTQEYSKLGAQGYLKEIRNSSIGDLAMKTDIEKDGGQDIVRVETEKVSMSMDVDSAMKSKKTLIPTVVGIAAIGGLLMYNPHKEIKRMTHTPLYQRVAHSSASHLDISVITNSTMMKALVEEAVNSLKEMVREREIKIDGEFPMRVMHMHEQETLFNSARETEFQEKEAEDLDERFRQTHMVLFKIADSPYITPEVADFMFSPQQHEIERGLYYVLFRNPKLSDWAWQHVQQYCDQKIYRPLIFATIANPGLSNEQKEELKKRALDQKVDQQMGAEKDGDIDFPSDTMTESVDDAMNAKTFIPIAIGLAAVGGMIFQDMHNKKKPEHTVLYRELAHSGRKDGLALTNAAQMPALVQEAVRSLTELVKHKDYNISGVFPNATMQQKHIGDTLLGGATESEKDILARQAGVDAFAVLLKVVQSPSITPEVADYIFSPKHHVMDDRLVLYYLFQNPKLADWVWQHVSHYSYANRAYRHLINGAIDNPGLSEDRKEKLKADRDKAKHIKSDQEMAGEIKNPGGIDLNSKNLNLNIKGDGQGHVVAFDQNDLAQFTSIDGLIPVILEIKPVLVSQPT